MFSLDIDDITSKLSQVLCVYNYKDVKKYKNISKSFNKYITKYVIEVIIITDKHAFFMANSN